MHTVFVNHISIKLGGKKPVKMISQAKVPACRGSYLSLEKNWLNQECRCPEPRDAKRKTDVPEKKKKKTIIIMPVGSDRWEGPKKINFSELGRLRIVLISPFYHHPQPDIQGIHDETSVILRVLF